MHPFEHYLYVLECGDGSLYTGYTTDVAARVAAHQAGTGAKYTKSHAPVSLLAQARFHSKERAMSAEALFKQLPRDRKDALLAKAAEHPFEDVLCQELPGFGIDTAHEFACRSLSENIDAGYQAFQAKLIPSVKAKSIVGVRTPALRRIAKELARRDDVHAFTKALPHRLFEENQLHAFVIGCERDYDAAIELYDAFLPYVDNWATCDQLPTSVFAKRPADTLERVEAWLATDHCYTIRFGIGILMHHFMDERFEPRFLEMVARTRMPNTAEQPASKDDIYYVDMVRAWYLTEAMAKQERAALPYLERSGEDALLDEWTRRKAIQKSVESRRITDEMKDHLRACR